MSQVFSGSLAELAVLLEAEAFGDTDRIITGVQSLVAAGPTELAPYTDSRYRSQLEDSRAGALLVREFFPDLEHDQLVCAEPTWALAMLLGRFCPEPPRNPGTHPTAVIDSTASVDPSASVGPYAVIGSSSHIGAEVILHPGVVIGDHCSVGERSVLHPGVVVYANTTLGKQVVVHAGTVLGSDGFGYVPHGGELVKVPQIGRLVVEDGVEIGANSTLDRATLDETRIGTRSKLDNLVQVGHNVRLGADCIVCGQAGIAGSTRLGSGVVMGGQSGAADHLEIGDGVQVAAKSAVLQSVDPGLKMGGVPARPLAQWRRLALLLPRIPELFRRVRSLERLSKSDADSTEGGE